MIDTGAACNLLRRNVYDKIVERTHQVHYLEYLRPSPRKQAVNGTHIKVIGETEIQLDLIPDPVSVIIVENISHDMILGEISLRSGAAVINMGNDSLTWYGRIWRQFLPTYHSLGPTAPETGDNRIDKLVRKNADIFSA